MNTCHPLFLEELESIANLNLPYVQLRGRTVAVTGAGGLIGRYLIHALDAVSKKHRLNLQLVAMSRDPRKTKLLFEGIQNLSCIEYDACRPLKAELRADYIIHAASNAHPTAFSLYPVETMQANILGTMHLLELMRETGGRFILCSTGEIYGENPDAEGFDEQSFGKIDSMAARSCYPESKRAAETLCASYARQYGVDALAARLTYTYGATITDKNSRADAQFLRKALSGEDIVMKSTGVQMRSYCYAPDAAAALITLMLKGESGQAYNIADPGCAVSIRTYAQTMADLANVKLVFDLPPEHEQAGYSKVSKAILKSDKLLSLGWSAKYDLREGLRRTLEISR